MKKKVIFFAVAAFALTAFFASNNTEVVTESTEGAYGDYFRPDTSVPAQFIDFEPMEIIIPVSYYDFSDEDPMVITSGDTDEE
jgi:hypothetical protein|tara:strand:+ start:404 stop:652 length:249 start_codon:yes stop_codon:yes gene_type:complete